MNKHIEKFARECGAWNQVYGNRTFMIDEHFDIEKFAQLIVGECAVEADRQTIYCRGIPWGRWIREHFGLQG